MSIKLFFLVFPALFLPLSLSSAQVRLVLTNNPFPFEYTPGADFDSREVPPLSSPSACFPLADVQVRTRGSMGQLSTVALSGGLSSHTRLSVDGVVLDSPQMSSMDAGILPLELSGGVDIYRSGLQAFGASGAAGLVNFRLGTTAGGSELSLYGGSFWQYGARWLSGVRTQTGQWSWGLSLSGASNDYLTVDGFGFTNSAVNLDFFKAGGFVRWQGQDFRAVLVHSSRLAGTGDRYAGLGRQDDHLTAAGLNWSSALGTMDLSLSRWYNVYTSLLPGQSAAHDSGDGTLRVSSRLDYKPWSLMLSARERAMWAVSTALGTHFNNDISAGADAVYKSTALDIGAGLTAGLRGPYRPYLLPTAGASWYAAPGIVFNASVSRALREPTFNELFWPADAWSRGNPDLMPEDGWNGRVSLIWALPILTVRLGGSLGLMDNLIVWAPDAGVWSPVNTGSALITTADASVTAGWNWGGLRISADASVSANRTAGNIPGSPGYGLQLAYVPHFKASASLRAGMENGWHVRASWRYTSERSVNDAQTVFLPAYAMLDMDASAGIFTVSIENALDTRAEDVQGYPLAGRGLRAGLRFTW